MRCLICISICLFSLPKIQAQSNISEELICKENSILRETVKRRGATVHTFYGYSIDYNRCNWEINPLVNSQIKGAVFSRITINKTTDSIGFDMHDSLIVDSVLHNHKQLKFQHINHILYVSLSNKWQNGSTDSLTIYYHGRPTSGAGIGYTGYDYHKTGPIFYTLSQPYGAAYWWPCKMTLTDKIDSMDIFITTHPSLKAASNGKLISNDSISSNTRIFHWKHRYPIAPYLVAVAVTNYSDYTSYSHFHNRPDSLPVVNYIYPEVLKTAMVEADEIHSIMRLYDSLFGEYPFMKEKYGHAQIQWGGGMEHQTMSFVSSFNYDLLAHELAHQWFGDMVTCGSWEDLWLNEGFATYLNALAYEYLRSKKEFIDWMLGVRGSATNQEDGSVLATDTNTINRLFSGTLRYNKGAFVLHMLRQKIGDAAFYASLKNYLQAPKSAYHFALTSDFQAICETQSGKKLDTFFNQWYKGEGFPYLKMNWEQTGSEVKLTIQQTPSHNSVPFFYVPVPVLFKSDTKDSLVTVYPKQLQQTFKFLLPFSADTAEFDPKVTVLTRYSLGGINNDKINSGGFQITPNPVRESLIISSYYNLISKIEIWDLCGRKIFETSPDFKPQIGEKIQIPVNTLSNGTYVTRIYTKKMVTSLKFIKT